MPIQLLVGSLDVQWLPAFAIAGSPAALFLFAIGVVLEAAWCLMSLKIAVERLFDAAAGDTGAQSPRETIATDAQAFRQLLLLGCTAVGLYLVLLSGRDDLAVVFGVAMAVVLPASIVVVAMDDSVLRGLDPRTWLDIFRRVGPRYSLLALQLLLLAIIGVGLAWASSRLPRWAGAPLLHLVALYTLFASYHALGTLLNERKEELDLASVSIIRPLLASPEEDIALREADCLANDDLPAAAAARLSILIRGQGASAPIHQRYRELLALVDDRDGLSEHARGYVAVMLALGNDREALALYLASLRMNPSFELVEPERVTQLIDLAARRSQSQLVISLASEFARRFPRDRDLVRNGLTAAMGMVRMGQQREALGLLSDLRTRFPDHPLSKELDSALLEFGK